MKVTIIIGPRGCGKLAKAREMAERRSPQWRECYAPPDGGPGAVNYRVLKKDGKPPPADGKQHKVSAFIFANAHEFTADQFLRASGYALDGDADLILTTVGNRECKMFNGRPAWLDKLIASGIAEVIELQPQTEAQKDFARICAIIESPTGGV